MKISKTDFTREYLKKYIELHKKNSNSFSKNFIAKILAAEHPEIYKDKEDARYHIRSALKQAGTSGSVKKSEWLLEQWAFISEPIHELNYKPFVVPKAYNHALITADWHGLFYDRKAVDAAINYGLKKKCNCCIIDGDFLDCYQFSKFDKSNRIAERFWEEREWGIDILKLLQDCFGYVIYKQGNHELRREKCIEQLPAKFSDLIELSKYEDYLRFDGSNVQFVEDYNIVQFGKLNIYHGHEMQGGGGIHVAYNRLNKVFDHSLSAHSHVKQESSKTTITGEVFGSWTLGCLCNLHPRYNPINNWCHGVADVEIEDDGMFLVENKRIIDGRIF